MYILSVFHFFIIISFLLFFDIPLFFGAAACFIGNFIFHLFYLLYFFIFHLVHFLGSTALVFHVHCLFVNNLHLTFEIYLFIFTNLFTLMWLFILLNLLNRSNIRNDLCITIFIRNTLVYINSIYYFTLLILFSICINSGLVF